ncbi:MAG: EscU/YscU/HrcU family type III secretion system export apparatus switch protein [Rhodocyclaceae bacterium]|jgi:flagellar biosynthesis protein|nr:EscU/YscU/HrcU family type III secretion system export apparatus switch protein [Rhodocyclaceae bacterium]
MAGHDRPSSPSSSHRDQAVALAYTPGEQAPRVVAKGKGLIAHEIIERAREAGVFVHESPELVGLLMQVDLDDRIPPQLYVAVAELLAWLYRVEQRKMPEEGNTAHATPAKP